MRMTVNVRNGPDAFGRGDGIIDKQIATERRIGWVLMASRLAAAG